MTKENSLIETLAIRHTVHRISRRIPRITWDYVHYVILPTLTSPVSDIFSPLPGTDSPRCLRHVFNGEHAVKYSQGIHKSGEYRRC